MLAPMRRCTLILLALGLALPTSGGPARQDDAAGPVAVDKTERAEVRLVFRGYNASERDELLQRFERAYQRGGG